MTEALPLTRLGLDQDVLDGPFVLPSGALGLLISPRGRDATLVSPSSSTAAARSLRIFAIAR